MSEKFAAKGDHFTSDFNINARHAKVLQRIISTEGINAAEQVKRAVGMYTSLIDRWNCLYMKIDDRWETVVPYNGTFPTVTEMRHIRVLVNVNPETMEAIINGQIQQRFSAEDYMDDALRVYDAIQYGKQHNAHFTAVDDGLPAEIVFI
jgi:hypothetical protein